MNSQEKNKDQLLADLAAMQQRIAALESDHAQLKQTHGELQQDVEQKARLLREVSHQFENSLVPVIGLLYAKRHNATIKPSLDCRDVLSDFISQVSVMSVTYRLFADYGWEQIPLSALANRVIRETLQTTPAPASITLQVSDASVKTPITYAKNLALILNELTMNTIQHAQCSGLCTIDVHITQDEAGTISLEFRDNGQGYPESVLSLRQDNALFIVRSLVRSLIEGELLLRNLGGAVCVIRFKTEETTDTQIL